MFQIRERGSTVRIEIVGGVTTFVAMAYIANGLTAGLVLYPIMKVLAGRARELRAGMLGTREARRECPEG